ncbi:MAG: serine protease [Dehalococcoidia bacterium]
MACLWLIRPLKLLGLVLLVLGLAFLGVGGYALYNYVQPPSRLASENLSKGVVEVQSRGGSGTGTIVRQRDAWKVLTAAHVVTDALGVDNNVRIISQDGSAQRARVESIDMGRDLAILEVEPLASWRAFPIEQGAPRPGEKVLTRCHFDSQPREGIHLGPADIKDLAVRDLLESLGEFRPAIGETIRSYVPTEAGCSGGPLVNRNGELLGIVLAGDGRTTVAVALGRTID